MCTLIFSSAHLSEFGIEEGYLILDLPKNPFWLLYLREEGGQNIVTVWVDQRGEKKKRYKSSNIFFGPSFRIWNRRRLSDFRFTQNPFCLLYLREEEGQTIVTVQVDQRGDVDSNLLQLICQNSDVHVLKHKKVGQSLIFMETLSGFSSCQQKNIGFWVELDSIAVSLFTNSETAAATPLRVMRNFQRTLNQ